MSTTYYRGQRVAIMNPCKAFEEALAKQASSRNRTANIWNSTGYKVRFYTDDWLFGIVVVAERSPIGLVDDVSGRICREMKTDTIRDVGEMLAKAKIKPQRVVPEEHVFLSGSGDNVLYTYQIIVYAKDDAQAEKLRVALSSYGVKIR